MIEGIKDVDIMSYLVEIVRDYPQVLGVNLLAELLGRRQLLEGNAMVALPALE